MTANRHRRRCSMNFIEFSASRNSILVSFSVFFICISAVFAFYSAHNCQLCNWAEIGDGDVDDDENERRLPFFGLCVPVKDAFKLCDVIVTRMHLSARRDTSVTNIFLSIFSCLNWFPHFVCKQTFYELSLRKSKQQKWKRYAQSFVCLLSFCEWNVVLVLIILSVDHIFLP